MPPRRALRPRPRRATPRPPGPPVRRPRRLPPRHRRPPPHRARPRRPPRRSRPSARCPLIVLNHTATVGLADQGSGELPRRRLDRHQCRQPAQRHPLDHGVLRPGRGRARRPRPRRCSRSSPPSSACCRGSPNCPPDRSSWCSHLTTRSKNLAARLCDDVRHNRTSTAHPEGQRDRPVEAPATVRDARRRFSGARPPREGANSGLGVTAPGEDEEKGLVCDDRPDRPPRRLACGRAGLPQLRRASSRSARSTPASSVSARSRSATTPPRWPASPAPTSRPARTRCGATPACCPSARTRPRGSTRAPA